MATGLPPILHHEYTKEKTMSKFAYIVYIETERETGLIASRDEQSEQIENELDALSGFQISGIGARSDSDYVVSNVDYWLMDKKDEREVNEEYERHVKAEEPDDATLRRELAAANQEAAKYKDLYERQKNIVEQLLESPELQPTRIWTQTREGTEKVRHFLPDGRYDHVFFKLDDVDDDSSVSIRIEDNGDLELRSNAMGREIMVLPRSGNELGVRVARRRG